MDSSFKANSLIFQFILILILTLINAFFSASEMAIVSLNKNKIKVLAEEGNKNAILIERLLQEPTKFLSTVQVGITLASFFFKCISSNWHIKCIWKFFRNIKYTLRSRNFFNCGYYNFILYYFGFWRTAP